MTEGQRISHLFLFFYLLLLSYTEAERLCQTLYTHISKTYTGWGMSRFTVVSTRNSSFLLYYYLIVTVFFLYEQL